MLLLRVCCCRCRCCGSSGGCRCCCRCCAACGNACIFALVCRNDGDKFGHRHFAFRRHNNVQNAVSRTFHFIGNFFGLDDHYDFAFFDISAFRFFPFGNLAGFHRKPEFGHG